VTVGGELRIAVKFGLLSKALQRVNDDVDHARALSRRHFGKCPRCFQLFSPNAPVPDALALTRRSQGSCLPSLCDNRSAFSQCSEFRSFIKSARRILHGYPRQLLSLSFVIRHPKNTRSSIKRPLAWFQTSDGTDKCVTAITQEAIQMTIQQGFP
jgi:hypothetical protein